MKAYRLAAILALIGGAAPASAQSVPDDVRCLLLSNVFGKAGNNEKAKEVASETMVFYIGRLDSRSDDQAITRAMRAQAPTIDAKTAGQEMNACVTRVTRAKQRIQTLGSAAQGTPRR